MTKIHCVLLSHEFCLQKYTTHQFTYFIYYLFQDNFKYAKIIKIQQVHHEIHPKQLFFI